MQLALQALSSGLALSRRQTEESHRAQDGTPRNLRSESGAADKEGNKGISHRRASPFQNPKPRYDTGLLGLVRTSANPLSTTGVVR